MQAAQRFSAGLKSASFDLRRAMLGLDTIRVMGLVESGRLGAEGNRIKATMDHIGTYHQNIIRLLQRIRDVSTQVNGGIAGLPSCFAKAWADAHLPFGNPSPLSLSPGDRGGHGT